MALLFLLSDDRLDVFIIFTAVCVCSLLFTSVQVLFRFTRFCVHSIFIVYLSCLYLLLLPFYVCLFLSWLFISHDIHICLFGIELGKAVQGLGSLCAFLVFANYCYDLSSF